MLLSLYMLTRLNGIDNVIWIWNVPIELAINKDILFYFILSLRTSQYNIHPIYRYYRLRIILMKPNRYLCECPFCMAVTIFLIFLRAIIFHSHNTQAYANTCPSPKYTYFPHMMHMRAYISLVLPSFARMFRPVRWTVLLWPYISVTCFIHARQQHPTPRMSMAICICIYVCVGGDHKYMLPVATP